MKIRKIYENNELELFPADVSTKIELPLFQTGISAGFPSPAEDYIEDRIDLNRELIKNPSSTFFGRVNGDSMIKAGISNGDLIIVDKSIAPKINAIVVCFIDGEFTIKRFVKIGEEYFLMPENDRYKPIKISKENDFRIWGTVTYTIKKH
ncbi:MAG TPA: translesion error-prone DNA polymerase V autoproteolytic subunit [Prolixibacteraceae bacterium]|nr:translesion error-prone DNA polymerase V autoproteolytic subunit [Prolixibacteraceae bacterium]HPS12305.1 translesion error-prone DNA polymerase V autoproteolytic subunit [Prolixibacteraceae bacterium]